MSLKRKNKNLGQALLEFALILVVLLMIIFLIIEASRIMWAWITVQNAARAGARYAVTGDYDPFCATNGIPRYQYLCDEDNPAQARAAELRRPASIIKITHDELRALPLNETGTLTDDNGYEIFVWGVDDDELSDGVANSWRGSYMNSPRGPDPYGGKPNLPVAVRVIHYVPIITPFFRPIRSSIPVYGQTVLYNEPFDQLGGTGRSAGVPPKIEGLPTPGVTPTYTPTPTPGDPPTPTETPTVTNTPTAEPCEVRFTSSLVAGARFASVTGLWNTGSGNHTVTFYDITDGDDPEDPGAINLVELGTAVMQEDTNNTQICPGIGDTAPPNALNSPLAAGHLIKAVHSDGSTAVAQVQQGTDTPTPTFTPTPIPTSTLLPTNTPLPTATPPDPYVNIVQECVAPGVRTILVQVENGWPNEDITIFFDDVARTQVLAGNHNGSFTIPLTITAVNGQTHTVRAETTSLSEVDDDTIISPCPNITPTPYTVTPTSTPKPPDLIIVGQPILLNSTPINEYEPVDFQVAITNTGDIDVDSQFFVDIYFDPTEVFSSYISLDYSDGYIAVDSLAGNTSKIITVTAPLGFTGGQSQRVVYGMVDSLRSITEVREDNNVSGELPVVVTPVNPPTPTTTPENTDSVAGFVFSYRSGWSPQPRADVWLVEFNSPNPIVIGPVEADSNGDYVITGVPLGINFSAIACLRGTNFVYESPPLVTPPMIGVGLYMDESPTGCPMR